MSSIVDLITVERKEKIKHVFDHIKKEESKKKFVWVYSVTYLGTLIDEDTKESLNPMVLCDNFESLQHLQHDLDGQIEDSEYETKENKSLIKCLKRMKGKIETEIQQKKLWELFVKEDNWLICANKMGVKVK
jgi:aspartokinase